MFDIGFWEIVVVAVVALLVVGPDEFPTLVRNIGGWLGRLRRFVSETRSDLEQEFRKADELKQLMQREADLAELHEQVDARSIKNAAPPPAPPPRRPASEMQQDIKEDAVSDDSDRDATATPTPEASSANKH